MSVGRTLIVISLIGASFQLWKLYEEKSELKLAMTSADINRNGFIAIPTPSNLSTSAVIVLAAENCPKEDAQRADNLATELKQRDIPYTRAHSATFNIMNPDPLVFKRIDVLMKSALPIVFVNGRAKANPTLDEVLWEYRSSQK